jgi:CRP/FNR family cyclic AMP-dependent transcriptional regulator
VLKSAPQRVAVVLCRLASTAPSGMFGQRPGEIRLTHEQLADLVGITRETTTKLLGELRDAGLVQLRRGGIVVLDHAELRATADHSRPGHRRLD